MAVYYALGDALVGKDEMHAKAVEGKFTRFNEALAAHKSARIEFMSGTATSENLLREFQSEGETIGFEPIGIGKPLTVQLRHIYTGEAAQGFWGKKDMLITSAMKSIATYDAAPRAVNFLLPKTENKKNVRMVAATDKGTPLICYSPSLAQSSSVVTVEVIFDNFPKEMFDELAQAFSSAASIPVFAPANAYLVAASVVTKLLGSIGRSLSNGTPELRRTEEITFVTPGSEKALAHFVLLIDDNVEDSVTEEYKVNAEGKLVRVADGQLYDGSHPYVVLSLDGRANDDFKGFTPTAASAAQLERFFNIKEGGNQTFGSLNDALKLFNDLKFREKATAVADKMKGLDKASKEYQDLSTQYNAYLGNIGNELLKPGNNEAKN